MIAGNRQGRRAAVVVALALLCFLGWPALSAADDLNHAGVVVRHGDGRLTYAYVAFAEESISGIDLLRRTGIPLVTAGFGALGEGVCAIADEGCPASECRQRVCQGPGDDDPFWQYFRQAAPGDWRPVALGASSTRVRDGDVDGWSWTPGAPRLPAASLADIAQLVGAGESVTGEAREMPSAVLRDVYPPGTAPPAGADEQAWVTYAGAGALLAALGAAAFVAVRRSRRAVRAA